MSDLTRLLAPYTAALEPDGGTVRIVDAATLRERVIDDLAHAAVFGSDDERTLARWIIWEAAAALGIYPDTMHHVYLARGRGDMPGTFTTPAINLRAMTYDMAQAVFRAALKRRVGLVVFEIARSEIAYTNQRPAEYTAAVLAAAIKTGFSGPVFLQGDHFQVRAGRYAQDAQREVQAVCDLISEALAAGFCNIDLDTSTLVDLGPKALDEQQRLNYTLSAELAAFIRARQPDGIEVSIGGEIGEVGGHNSTEQELRAFMDGFNRRLPRGLAGLSKVCIQTGTSSGGVVLPDGGIAHVAVDFDTLFQLSRVARQEYQMAGAVQHGASTLPESAFHKFVENEACEVHLATDFQNILYEHEAFPPDLRRAIYAYLNEQFSDERAPNMTDEQFYYRARKFALGPFKQALWELDAGVRAELRAAWEAQIGFLFEQLGVVNSADLVTRYCQAGPRHRVLAG
ncbi:MAG: class II fructose-bisphosphate aldolase [Anaerolineae bacterium]|nr:class II fructose-bisphosphate aldolase [Anaerolineae bacterium]